MRLRSGKTTGEELAMGDIAGLGYLGLTGPLDEWRPLARNTRAEEAATDSPIRRRVLESMSALGASPWKRVRRGWDISDGRSAVARRSTVCGTSSRPRDFRRDRSRTRPRARRSRAVQRAGIRPAFPSSSSSAPRPVNAPFQSPTGARFVTSSAGKTLGSGPCRVVRR